jgi:outer membrane protein OmpA-like peptidoglycan-associated protein
MKKFYSLLILSSIVIITAMLVSPNQAYAQQDFGIQGMDMVPQRTAINPGFIPKPQLYIGFAPIFNNIHLTGGHSGFAYSKLIQKDGDSLLINMDDALGSMANTNYLSFNAAIDLIAFGIGNGKYYFKFNMTERVQVRMLYPKSLMNFAWRGNGAFLGETVDFSSLNANVSHFREYGFTYARNFLEGDLSVGITGKYLYGMENVSTDNRQLDIQTDENTFDITANTDFTLNSSGVLSDDPFADLDQDAARYLFMRNNHGFAFDIGASYNINERFTVAASGLDIGAMYWANDPVNQEISNANFTYQGVDLSVLLNQNDSSDVFQNLIDTLSSTFNPVEDSASYNYMLPSRMYVSGFYNFKEKHQVGAHFYGEFYKGHFEPGFAIQYTGKFTDIFSVSATYSYFNRDFTNLGVSFALTAGAWQLFFGMDNIIAPIIPQHSKNFHLHTGMNLVFRYKDKKQKISDRDKDGIPDAFDECPDEFGLEIHFGCPDRDGDGIRDINDICPDVVGPLENNGCPWTDKDNDGLMDNEDDCPEVPGPKENAGCPWGDTDEDGVMDNLDSCITIVGPAANNGCPYGDKDGDTILDNADPCPDVPGPVENNGCPYGDKDGDGIKDDADKCPEIPGPVDNYGCPYVDSDQDGTIDKDDLCPRTPGPIDNQGCPVIKKEEQEVLNTAFDNLEFQSGSNVIKGSSYTSLDDLSDLLKKKEDWQLKVSGHTDDVGSESVNLRLSEKRSKSVQKYLVNRGISGDRIIVKWYGESLPIYPNSTAEGRQKNRRVEMEVVFK